MDENNTDQTAPDSLAGLFSQYGHVDELDIDEEFDEHLRERAVFEKHRVMLSEVLEVQEGTPRYFRNRGGRRAPVIMVGLTVAGRILCVPIEPTGRQGVWRPVTAFEANTHDKERFRRSP